VWPLATREFRAQPDKVYNSKFILQTGTVSKKAWRTGLKGKLKFSVSDSCIEDSFRQLRELNQDFTALSDQTSKLVAAPAAEHAQTNSQRGVKQCSRIREASIHLFEALRVACSQHKEHRAHIQVERPQWNQREVPEHSDVHFCLGISSKKDDPTKCGPPKWLLVKSIFEPVPKSDRNPRERREAMEALSRLATSLKRVPNSCCCSNHRKKIRKENAAIRASSPSDSSCCAHETCPANSIGSTPFREETAVTNPSRTARLGPNFCKAHNLCMCISRASNGPANISNTCLGHLAQPLLTHELYIQDEKSETGTSRSLQDWMKSIGERNRCDRVPILECLRLARNLALLVLRFHTTPLLRESWDGEDIEFFDLGAESSSRTHDEAEKLPRPFLKVEVSPAYTHTIGASELSSLAGQVVRNNYLFRLGVIFLELAYQTPLSSLNSRNKYRDQTEFDKANQYSKIVGSILGPRYAKIVRKCLGCDFGQDVDLGSPELEAAVYRHVVVELDQLVRAFEKMEIAE
jgi:hypothetical protein